jgi:hypothetical protein
MIMNVSSNTRILFCEVVDDRHARRMRQRLGEIRDAILA